MIKFFANINQFTLGYETTCVDHVPVAPPNLPKNLCFLIELSCLSILFINTLISLPYGIFKPIYQIKPGDQIINGDNQIVTVKKLQIGNYGEKTTLFNNGTKLVLIKKHAFGTTPSQDTYITRSHPLYINNEFVWAESLINNDTVQWTTIVDDTFYNIECMEGNTFIANGLVAGDISVCNIDYENNQSLYTKANEKIKALDNIKIPIANNINQLFELIDHSDQNYLNKIKESLTNNIKLNSYLKI